MEKFIKNELFDLENCGQDVAKKFGKLHTNHVSYKNEKYRSSTLTIINDAINYDNVQKSIKEINGYYQIRFCLRRFTKSKKYDHFYMTIEYNEFSNNSIITKAIQVTAPASQAIVDDDDTYELGEYIRKIDSWERVSEIIKKLCEENVNFKETYIFFDIEPEEIVNESMISSLIKSINANGKYVYNNKLYISSLK